MCYHVALSRPYTINEALYGKTFFPKRRKQYQFNKMHFQRSLIAIFAVLRKQEQKCLPSDHSLHTDPIIYLSNEKKTK